MNFQPYISKDKDGRYNLCIISHHIYFTMLRMSAEDIRKLIEEIENELSREEKAEV